MCGVQDVVQTSKRLLGGFRGTLGKAQRVAVDTDASDCEQCDLQLVCHQDTFPFSGGDRDEKHKESQLCKRACQKEEKDDSASNKRRKHEVSTKVRWKQSSAEQKRTPTGPVMRHNRFQNPEDERGPSEKCTTVSAMPMTVNQQEAALREQKEDLVGKDLQEMVLCDWFSKRVGSQTNVGVEDQQQLSTLRGLLWQRYTEDSTLKETMKAVELKIDAGRLSISDEVCCQAWMILFS